MEKDNLKKKVLKSNGPAYLCAECFFFEGQFISRRETVSSWSRNSSWFVDLQCVWTVTSECCCCSWAQVKLITGKNWNKETRSWNRTFKLKGLKQMKDTESELNRVTEKLVKWYHIYTFIYFFANCTFSNILGYWNIFILLFYSLFILAI